MLKMMRRSLLVFATLASAAGVSALTTPPPDRAILALGALAPGDLDVTFGGGEALIASLFPGDTAACPMPTGPDPDFDRACMWSKDGDEADFDILIGIKAHSIVSVVTAWPRQLDAQTWACEPFSPEDPDKYLSICSVRTAPEISRARWAASWRAFLNSIN